MNIIDEMLNDGYVISIIRTPDLVCISCIANNRSIIGVGKTFQEALKDLSIKVLGF